MARPRFICDAMLGRLATWLRILGYPAEFIPEIDDDDLIRRAEEGGLAVCTRDRALLKRRFFKTHPFILVESDFFREQLVEIIRTFGLDREGEGGICPRCNRALSPVNPDDPFLCVPPYVRETQTQFSRCPQCGRVFWPATHRHGMREELAAIFRKAGDESRR